MSVPIRATTWSAVPGELINATTGAAFVGTVTVYLQIDSGTQASIGSATAAGNGTYTIDLTTDQTNGNLIKLTFTGSGAIPALVTIPTVTATQQAAASVVSGSVYIPTVLDLITGSLQDLNICASGDTPDPTDVHDAFLRFNDFLDDLKNEPLSLYTITRTTWTLVASTASYTIGSTGTIAIDRPASPNDILNIGYIDTSVSPVYERLIGPVLTEDQYASNPLKALTGVYPLAFYYNPTTPPTGILWPFPIPTSTTLQGVLYAPALIGEYAALTDPIILPSGYRRFFRNQLTIELASLFQVPPPPQVVQAAAESRLKIKRKNTRMSELSLPTGLPGLGRSLVYDISSDQ